MREADEPRDIELERQLAVENDWMLREGQDDD
jgi:hypothetical protein